MEDEKVVTELQAAERALNAGKFDEAERLLDLAAHGGATPLHISDLGRRVRAARIAHESHVGSSVWFGFFIALIGYAVVSSRQPDGWTKPVWLVLALAVVPGVAGLFVGRRHAGERSRAHAFMDGLKSGIWAMACYSGFNLLILADKLQKEASQSFDEYVAALLTVIVFSAIAGGVSGLISAAASLSRPRGKSA